MRNDGAITYMCSHYKSVPQVSNGSYISDGEISFYPQEGRQRLYICDTSTADLTAFKAFLADEYANGTPVCIWYVLASPVTESTTAPTITPASGSNTLTVGTTLAPSEVSITGHIS